MARRHYKVMNKTDFEQIKLLQNAKLSASKIHQITGRSYGVIGSVRKATDFGDYKNVVRNEYMKYAVARENKPTVTLTGNTDTRSVIDALYSISENLEKLVKAWEETPQRKGIFG